MKTFVNIAIMMAAAAVISSCRVTEYIDPNIEIPNLGGIEYPDMIINEGQPDEYNLDEWLREMFLNEYNIEVQYRWDAVKMYHGVTAKLVPVEVDKVKPMMETIASIWFRPFIETAGYGFLQKYSPKTLVLVGSPEYTADGSGMTLGTAEGAVKILLLNANAFSATNKAVLRNYMHVILHEFTHVLNQNLNYDPSFEDISRGTYDPADWGRTGVYSYDGHDAWRRGFFSNYSMVSPEEDYAEVLSLVLVNGRDWVENTVKNVIEAGKDSDTTSEALPGAYERLWEKIDHVEAYLMAEFGISLWDDPDGTKGLVTHVQEAIDTVVENALNNM